MNTIKRTLTGTFLAAACATAAAAQDNTARSNVLAEAICDAAKDHKYILIGDTNHGSSEIRNAFFNEKLIARISDCLPTSTFVFEQPPKQMSALEEQWTKIDGRMKEIEHHRSRLKALKEEYAEVQALPERQKELNQRIANNTFLSAMYNGYVDYYERKIATRQSIIELSEQILSRTAPAVKQLGMMRDTGFDIRFYDPGYNLNPDDTGIVKMLQDAYVDDPACMNITLLFSIASATDTPGIAFNRMLEILRGRDDDNPPIANTVLQNHPDGALIFYGAAHMNGLQDLDELLGDEDSFWISISEDYHAPLSEGFGKIEKLMSSFKKDTENPDRIFDIATGTIFAPTRAPDDVEFTEITQAEFDSCVRDLPRNMQDGFTRNGGADFTFSDFRWLMDEDRAGLPPILESWTPPFRQPG